MSSLFVDEDASSDAPVRSKTNPFLDFPQDSKASEVKEGLLRRKLHADVDGKRSEPDSNTRSMWCHLWAQTFLRSVKEHNISHSGV